ncbi:MAG TPA: amidase [Burkholderiales bacterium]|nr:amidase [Burkholderiales bacterium]
MSDLAYLSAAELAQRIARREISPLELVHATLARVERSQPILNAFITICAEEALHTARDAESAVMRGRPLGPLHGVPFSVKDLIDTRGVRTTYGSVIFEHHVPATDAVAVARLKAAGAILIGKTTTPEFGQKGLTEAPLFGRTRNAWRPDRTSGGSSGGAAVAAAAGLGPIGVASDGGGSTRIPAACNGVVGFKQSLGVVPVDSAQDAFGNISYTTPMSRTVMDTALMLEAMAGPHPSDPHSLNRVKQDFVGAAGGSADLGALKMAWRPFLGNKEVSAEVLDLCAGAVAGFSELGAHVFEMPDDFEPAEPLWLVVNGSYRLAQYGHHLKDHRDRMDPTLVAQLERASGYSAEELYRAIFLRTRMYRQVQSWFEQADLVVTPTLSRTALPLDQDFFAPIEIDGNPIDTMRRAWYPYTLPFNMTGNPAVSLPCGWASDGLPAGLQLIARIGEDALLLRAAAAFEKARPWAHRRPPLPALDA